MWLSALVADLPTTHKRSWIPGGTSGTEATIQRMQDLVTHGKRDFRVRKQLQHILADCSPKDYWCYGNAIFLFCRDKIRYVFDPNGVELLETPYAILQSRVADCDSISVLVATLFEQAGFPTRFVCIKADSERPDEYSHVFVEVNIPGHGWQGADCTQPTRPFGWSPPLKHRRKTWPGSKDGNEAREGDAMAGLNDTIPAREYSRGFQAGSEFNFRLEPVTMVTTSPEALELNTLSEKNSGEISSAPGNDFFLATEAETRFTNTQEDAQLPKTEKDTSITLTIKPNYQKLYVGLGLLAFGIFCMGGRR